MLYAWKYSFFLVKQCVWDIFSVLFQLLDPTKLSRWRRNNNGRRDVVWNFNVKTIVHKMHRMCGKIQLNAWMMCNYP